MYELVSAGAPLTHGDIVVGCTIIRFESAHEGVIPRWILAQSTERVLILTQACDIANGKVTRLQVAVVQDVEDVVALGQISRATIRDHVRLHRAFGLYFLPEWEGHLSESIVDLRNIHTVPLKMLEELAQKGNRVRLGTPYREHLAQHFAVTYSRIALPEPYQTK
jgi:hypothetical protein